MPNLSRPDHRRPAFATLAQWAAILIPAVGMLISSIALVRSLNREGELIQRVHALKAEMLLEHSDYLLSALDWTERELHRLDELDARLPEPAVAAVSAVQAADSRKPRGRQRPTQRQTTERIEFTCSSSDPLCGLDPR